MSILDHKISQLDIDTAGVAALPDVLTGSADENKKLFDRLVHQVVSQKFNALLEELSSELGAEQIGAAVEGISGSNVQQLLKNLKKDIDSAAFHAGSVSSVFGRGGNVVAQTGDYTPQQVGAAPAIHSAKVTLGTLWTEEGTCWVQPLEHELVTAATRVDLYPDSGVMNQLRKAGTTALYVENRNGAAYAVAMGNAPAEELLVQADFVEVTAV